MSNELAQYLANNTYADPAARTPLRRIIKGFWATLSPRERRVWPAWRVRKELGAKYLIGRNRNFLHVVGISLSPPRSYTVDAAGNLICA